MKRINILVNNGELKYFGQADTTIKKHTQITMCLVCNLHVVSKG